MQTCFDPLAVWSPGDIRSIFALSKPIPARLPQSPSINSFASLEGQRLSISIHSFFATLRLAESVPVSGLAKLSSECVKIFAIYAFPAWHPTHFTNRKPSNTESIFKGDE